MRKVILSILVLASLSTKAQVSDTLIIKMDTTTFKNVIAIIQKQLDSKTASNYVLEALSKYELISTKPKEIKK